MIQNHIVNCVSFSFKVNLSIIFYGYPFSHQVEVLALHFFCKTRVCSWEVLIVAAMILLVRVLLSIKKNG